MAVVQTQSPPSPPAARSMTEIIWSVLSSLRLTVVLLALGMVLVFVGTLAQVNLGLYKAQREFFQSLFVFWTTPFGLRIPILPGGYLLGGLLLLNLFAAHFRYFQATPKKIGIVLIHTGIVLLLLGQLFTDLLSVESQMHLRLGETKNYSEVPTAFELAIVDTTDAKMDKVVAIAPRRLFKGGEITHPELPFTVRLKKFLHNSTLQDKPTPGYSAVEVTHGAGVGLFWREEPHVTQMDMRDMPSGIIEIVTPQGVLGTYLVSAYIGRPQTFTHNGRTYQITLRLERIYKMHSLQLLEFRHDKYPGTDIPKNFSSRVRLRRADTDEDREVLIYMNNPLRYAGETYYQARFDVDNQGTILQVVRNPSWLTPYFSCVLVGVGLMVQFGMHLVGFVHNRNRKEGR
jgi:hypothetical protein